MTARNLRPPVSPLLQRVHGVDRVLTRVQDNVDRATKEARANPENRGRLIESVSIPATGNVTINHKLGRVPRGFTERKRISGTPAYTQKAATSRLLVLTGTAVGVVDLWVF